ncbi:hypothetical protein IVB30_02755 [Bradyrhizobium sp. 200]|uniref:hypothetical protein n=1 Tax=Bradyrhizobium sp. 200 TaxID=2782665 RepID=UPI001FFECD8D|nr:hypothetical protein [Bradyrhizobium sp. 200]UPJ50370.1 hypothetical protein IVB30_02755 [Bradyrhizobium sp. 200]
MSLRTIGAATALAVICLSSSTMAYSEVQYGAYQLEIYVDPDFPRRAATGLIVLSALVIAVGVGVCLSQFSGGSSATYDDADRFQNEADLMHKIAKHQDAQTALMRSEIDYARTHGEHRERPEIAEHEQRLRELRSKLR